MRTNILSWIKSKTFLFLTVNYVLPATQRNDSTPAVRGVVRQSI